MESMLNRMAVLETLFILYRKSELPSLKGRCIFANTTGHSSYDMSLYDSSKSRYLEF